MLAGLNRDGEVISIEMGSARRMVQKGLQQLGGGLTSLQFVSQGQYLVATDDRGLRVLNYSTRKIIFRHQEGQPCRFSIDPGLAQLAVFSDQEVFLVRISGTDHFEEVFSYPEMAMLAAIARRLPVRSEVIRKVYEADPNMMIFYFNAAVMAGNYPVIESILREGHVNLEADDAILHMDPLTYATKYNMQDISALIVEKCTQDNVYSRLHYNSGPVTRQFLVSFFQEEKGDFGLPKYG